MLNADAKQICCPFQFTIQSYLANHKYSSPNKNKILSVSLTSPFAIVAHYDNRSMTTTTQCRLVVQTTTSTRQLHQLAPTYKSLQTLLRPLLRQSTFGWLFGYVTLAGGRTHLTNRAAWPPESRGTANHAGRPLRNWPAGGFPSCPAGTAAPVGLWLQNVETIF